MITLIFLQAARTLFSLVLHKIQYKGKNVCYYVRLGELSRKLTFLTDFRGGGGLKALVYMSAKNVSFLWTAPLILHKAEHFLRLGRLKQAYLGNFNFFKNQLLLPTLEVPDPGLQSDLQKGQTQTEENSQRLLLKPISHFDLYYISNLKMNQN